MGRNEIMVKFEHWMDCWNNHDLNGVLEWMDEDVVFEHWTGAVFTGKNQLRKAWIPWFENHEDFSFHTERLFFDESAQELTFLWTLNWPSRQKNFRGMPETRRGIDVIELLNAKIVRKASYSKTSYIINDQLVTSKP